MKPNGWLLFFNSGTNTELVTYKDELETIPNATEVAVLPNGNVQNVFYQGSAKVLYLDEFGQQYAERDPVGGQTELGNFTLWETTVTYDESDIVKGLNGKFYVSLSNANTANDPTLDPGSNEFWEEWPVNGIYNSTIPYDIGEVVQSTAGNLWRSLTNPNLNNDPESDDGTNWLPAIDGDKVRVTTVLPTTVSGSLVAGGQINQIRDSGAFGIPLANSVVSDTILVVELPNKYAAETPSATVSGSDNLEDENGIDPDGVIDWVGAARLTLTSDGVDTWSL